MDKIILPTIINKPPQNKDFLKPRILSAKSPPINVKAYTKACVAPYCKSKVIEKYNGVDVDNLYNSKKNRNSKERLSKEDSQKKLSYYLTKYISKNNTLSERLPWHCSRDISALFISINYSESNQPEIVKLIADNHEAVVSYFDQYFTLSFYKFQPDENYFKDLIDVNNQIFEFMNTN